MAKVRVATLETATAGLATEGFAGGGRALTLLGQADDPIRLHLHELGAGEMLTVGPMAGDCAGYVWQGSIVAGDRTFEQGSSLVIEHGARIVLRGGAEGGRLFTFVVAKSDESGRAGGHVHGLPAAQVPHSVPHAITASVGGIHNDSTCPTCTAWLHENGFPAMTDADARAVAGRGIHRHSEDEVIVVTEGSIRLGIKLYGPGTALAIAADTLYGFTPGPEGLRFINFRPVAPAEIRFPDGRSMDEIAYWRDLLGTPPAIELVAA